MLTVFGFEKLQEAATLIARHPISAEKAVALDECLDDIEARFAHGELDLAQKRRLIAILLGADHTPCHPPDRAEGVARP
jgi:hypothetical protein